LLDAVSPEDVGRVARNLYELAIAGDVAAAKVLPAYAVGNPAPAPDPDRLDLDELGLLLAQPLTAQLVLYGLGGVDPAAALAFLRHVAARREPSADAILDGCQGTVGAMQLASLQKRAVEARAKVT
jgi:hypothetical protein